MIIILLMIMLVLGIVVLVWFGVIYGLCILILLRICLVQCRGELVLIFDVDVFEEIQLLISIIDDLFVCQVEMIILQNCFIVDVVYQLCLLLVGMVLYVDQVLVYGDLDMVCEVLQYICWFNQCIVWVSIQLLVLSWVQIVLEMVEVLDLCEWVLQWVGICVFEVICDGIDLGYCGSFQLLCVFGNGVQLQEVLDNLIDNVLCYVGCDVIVIVGVYVLDDNDVELYVEDNGFGVFEDVMSWLGECFFCVFGIIVSGIGLGLVIVYEVVEYFGGCLSFFNCFGGGFKVVIMLLLLKGF